MQWIHRRRWVVPAVVVLMCAELAVTTTLALPGLAPTTQETNKPLEPRMLLRGGHSPIRALSFAPDNKSLATGAEDGTVILWELTAGSGKKRTDLPIPERAGAILTVSFSPDGQTLLTASARGDVILWDIAQQKPRATTKVSSLSSARFSPDGRFVLIARGELADNEEDLDHVQLLDAMRFHNRHVIDIDFEYVFDAVFTPDGAGVAVSGGESLTPTPASRGGQQRCGIELWTIKPDGSAIKGKRFGADSPRPLLCPTFSGGGKLLAAASGDWLVWSVPENALLTTLRASRYEARVCAFSPSVRWLATGALDSSVQLWSIKDWQSIYLNKGDTAAGCSAIGFSSDGEWLAAARSDLVAVFAVPAR